MSGVQSAKVSVRRAQKRLKQVSKQVRSTARTATGSWRPLPDFLVIGTQKGGTTSLHTYLSGHPDTAASNVKEVHYFDRELLPPLGWYRGHFPLRAQGRTVFETTPRYLFQADAAQKIHAVLPDVRMIALLRDPVERALSHYRMSSRGSRETLGMLEAFEAEEERTAQQRTAEQRDADRDWYAYKARGRYAEQLERYYAHFDRDQILVVRSEDLFSEPAATCDTILQFLGLAQPPAGLTLPQDNKTLAADVPPEARAHLEQAFAGPNEDLAELLGRRLW